VLKAIGPPKCVLCTKNVYKVEEVLAISKIWHKTCFKCGGSASDGCQKTLNLGKYLVHDEQPYCEACYSKLFRPKGFGYANTLSVYSDAIDVENARSVVSNQPGDFNSVSAPVTPVTSTLRHFRESEKTFSTPTSPISRAPIPSDTRSVDSSVSSTVKKKFNLGGSLAPKCYSCQKSVYKVEEVVALGNIWHKSCFKCGGVGTTDGCGRTMTLDKYLDHDGQPYCNSCYSKQFKPKGFGFAANLQTGMSLPAEEMKS
jgi:cysteine and glycine-rich protein